MQNRYLHGCYGLGMADSGWETENIRGSTAENVEIYWLKNAMTVVLLLRICEEAYF